MRHWSLARITYGCELELGDIDTRISIPHHLGKWDFKDGSISNSNGTANDPQKVLNKFGGEIQVTPASHRAELVDRIDDIYKLFPKKAFNYTTNFHVHVGIPHLRDDLNALKKIATYLKKYGKEMFDLIDPVPKPPKPEIEGAMKRYKRRLRSHHYQVSDAVYDLMMAAKTPEEFYEAHAPEDQRGRRQWQLVVRAGVNLAHLWKTNTIEFRCFTMSPDLHKMFDAISWCKAFLEAALETNDSPKNIIEGRDYDFQKFFPYDEDLDRIFQLTNVYHNSRKTAKKNYEMLIRHGVLTRKELGLE